MKKETIQYKFEGAEDHARFLEYVTSKGYELEISAEGYSPDMLPEGRFNRDEFVSKYEFVRQVFILHKTEVERDGFGNILKSWNARSGDFPSRLVLWYVGGELETLIEDYISRK